MNNNLINLTAIKKTNRMKYYNTLYKNGYDKIEKTVDNNGDIWIEKSFLNPISRKKPNSVRSTPERTKEYNRIKQQERRKKLKENKENNL